MRTFLVTGNDTGVGKTWVAGALARAFSERGRSVQLVKPVETGVEPGAMGDAVEAAAFAGGTAVVEAVTLSAYRAAMAPLDAARLEGVRLSLSNIVEKLRALPEAEVRIIEGAGGLAVPLSESGEDWIDLAKSLGVDGTLIVLADRLGAINQARLCHHYAVSAGLRHAFWLNAQTDLDLRVAQSNRRALGQLRGPLVGETSRGERAVARIDWEWFEA